jgi:hypothetical protein
MEKQFQKAFTLLKIDSIMKWLKRIFIAFLILITLVLTVALFIPRQYQVEREIVIAKNKDSVFQFISHLKNQNLYSVWAKTDPDMKASFSGTDGMAGFVSYWDSKNKSVGKGSQTITRIVEGDSMYTHLRFEVPFEAEDDSYMSTKYIDDNHTKVTWGFKGEFPYPMNIMKLFINMEEMIGNDFNTGLQNLKSLLEQK